MACKLTAVSTTHTEYAGAGGAQERLVKFLKSKLQKDRDIYVDYSYSTSKLFDGVDNQPR